MNCPRCSIALTSTDYEGFRVLQCGQCCGHFVGAERLDSIKRVGEKSPDDLRGEATAEFKGANPDRVKCPRCRALMRKEAIRPPVVELKLDACESCKHLWLDGGVLALLQLIYQAGPKFAHAQEMKRRMAELEASPERKAEFEEQLANLPLSDPLSEAVGETLSKALWSIGPRFF